MKNLKIAVSMSGGVDSSVAALLLKKNGYLVEGIYMKNWEDSNCDASNNDIFYVKSVCNHLNINLHILNFSKEYWNKVFVNFLKDYKLGLTPNPDISCNKNIKFNIFLNYVLKELNFDFIATGHYVKNCFYNSFQIKKSFDIKKDQSYFIYTLSEHKLKFLLFPLANYLKSTVRKIAKNYNLLNFDKKDSTGLCFVENKNFYLFLKKYIGILPGNILDDNNNIIGTHLGLMHYTVGQRKRLKIKLGFEKQQICYVLKKNIKKNELIVSFIKNSLAFFSKKIEVTNWNVFNISYSSSFLCTAKIRYMNNDVLCFVKFYKKKLFVCFKFSQHSITIGQSIVFYKSNLCVGGGIINNIVY